MASIPPILAIDFGTTYSSAAIYHQDKVMLVRALGEVEIPSVVHVPRHGDWLVGTEAVRAGFAHPESTVSSVKRIMGRTPGDAELEAFAYSVPFGIRATSSDSVVLDLEFGQVSPIQIAAAVIRRLTAAAEEQIQQRIELCVLSAPVVVADGYGRALERAAELCGLQVMGLVPEPVAGLVAFGYSKHPASRRIFVCDFGGGTLDLCCMAQEGRRFDAVVSTGDPYLGGDDFDLGIAEAAAGLVYRKWDVELHNDRVTWSHLVSEAEATKRMLSHQASARLHIPEAFSAAGKIHDIDIHVERAWAEARWRVLLERTVALCVDALDSAHWDCRTVDDVVLFGGTSSIPSVRQTISTTFGREVAGRSNASTAVALGAALYGASIAHHQLAISAADRAGVPGAA